MLVRAFEYEDNFPYNFRYKSKGEISFEIEWEFKYQIPPQLIRKGDLITTFTKDGRFQFDNVLNGTQELVKLVEIYGSYREELLPNCMKEKLGLLTYE